MGCLVLEIGITILVFVDGTINVGCPTTWLCPVLEVTPLTNDTTCVGGFPPMLGDNEIT